MINSKNNEMISCIIPMYNAESYIGRCITSVLNQTYKNIEIVVVDDGSNDSSIYLVQKFLSNHNIKLIQKKNGGVSSARNVGIYETTGEYLFFLDSDDFLPINSFEILINFIKQYSADIVIGRDICFYEGKKIPTDSYCGKVLLWEDDITLINTLKDFSNTWNVCGKLFKKSFIKTLSFVEGKGIGEDSYFFFQCALRRPKTVYIEKNVYFVSLRGGSATRSSISIKKIDDIIYFINRKKNDIQEQFKQYSALINNLEIKAYLSILSMLIRTDEYSKYEDESIKKIQENKKYYISGETNDRLYYVVIYNLYWIYKKIIRLLKY